MQYIYRVYILGHEVHIKSTPILQKFVDLQRCFSFSYCCCFPETDNPRLVTCSLNKCMFTNSQTMTACRHCCVFYQCPSNFTHSTSSERQRQCLGAGTGEGVCQSAPWRGTQYSAPFWPQLGVSREGGCPLQFLSAPYGLCE